MDYIPYFNRFKIDFQSPAHLRVSIDFGKTVGGKVGAGGARGEEGRYYQRTMGRGSRK